MPPTVLGNIDAPRAEPLYFTAADATCQGFLHRPAPAHRRDAVVVLCNPLGHELMSAHRTYRYLATRLAAEGYGALRFDYPSTGDSTGDIEDAGRLAAWIDSIRCAVAEARRLSGATQVILFGLRAGGTLAAAAASRLDAVTALAVWAPFASGSKLVRELRAMAGLNGPSDTGSASMRDIDESLHVGGFGFSPETVADLQTLSLMLASERPAPHCLLLQRDDLPAESRLPRHWQSLGAQVDLATVPGFGAMMLGAHESRLPLDAVESIIKWVQARDIGPYSGTEQALPNPRCILAPPAPVQPALEESTVWFGANRHLSAVVTRPASGPVHPTAVLFPTVGANHRIGCNRLHVNLARDLAALGYLCLRMDIDGTGESGTVSERERFWEYKSDTYLDVVEGSRWLTAQAGVDRCVMWGICSGAYMAYHAALADPSIRGAMLLNMQVFRWVDAEIRENVASDQAKSLNHYRRKALQLQTWRRLVSGAIQYRVILVGIAARIRKRLKGRIDLYRSRWISELDTPARQLRRLADRGCAISLVCSPDDGSEQEIATHLGSNARHVADLTGFNCIRVPKQVMADHTFSSRASQQWLRSWTIGHMQRHFQ